MIGKIKASGLAVFVAVAVFASFAFSQQAGQHSGSVDRFESILAGDGFAVSEGDAQHFDPVINYCTIADWPSAFYANKGAPYVAALVPTVAGQAPGMLPPLPGSAQVEFRINPREAVVLIGSTPPPTNYFSYQVYLLSRKYGTDVQPTFLFNSVGDTVSLSTIHATGPNPFNRQMVLIFTPDKDTDARIRSALLSAGYPAATINTLVIPSAMLHLGLDASTDSLVILNRSAEFKNRAAGDDYVAHPPLKVFRVTPQNTDTPNPFPVAPLRVRGTGHTEFDLNSEMARLRQAILDTYSGYKATEYHTQLGPNDGYDYIQRAVPAIGDSRDALYLLSGNLPVFGQDFKLTLGENDFLIAYGPNHVATGKATYTNINVYATEGQLALGSVFSDSLEGTARQYLPTDQAADLMYAYKISRNCGEGASDCLPIAPPDNCSRFTLDSDTQLGLFFRIYMEPPTKIGPAYTEILYEQVIKFSPNP